LTTDVVDSTARVSRHFAGAPQRALSPADPPHGGGEGVGAGDVAEDEKKQEAGTTYGEPSP
jgi:hypothetical protein